MTTEGTTDLNEILRSTVQSRAVRADKASIAFQFDWLKACPRSASTPARLSAPS
jgi:hypothetical protein